MHSMSFPLVTYTFILFSFAMQFLLLSLRVTFQRHLLGGDSMCAISIRDFVSFPVCADNTHVSSIHDFYGDNTSAATNRDINGVLIDKDCEMQTTHLG